MTAPRAPRRPRRALGRTGGRLRLRIVGVGRALGLDGVDLLGDALARAHAEALRALAGPARQARRAAAAVGGFLPDPRRAGAVISWRWVIQNAAAHALQFLGALERVALALAIGIRELFAAPQLVPILPPLALLLLRCVAPRGAAHRGRVRHHAHVHVVHVAHFVRFTPFGHADSSLAVLSARRVEKREVAIAVVVAFVARRQVAPSTTAARIITNIRPAGTVMEPTAADVRALLFGVTMSLAQCLSAAATIGAWFRCRFRA